MISLTKLLTGAGHYGDQLRYTPGAAKSVDGVNENLGPVVAWNMTRTCNLSCRHCYMDSEAKKYIGELDTHEALTFIESLASFKVPVLLFSGGEPLVREDFFKLAEKAGTLGIRPTLSTNGTLIDRLTARRLKDTGVGYVGISLDGLESNHDYFRRQKGAYKKAMQGIENCVAIGQKVGLRFTINRHNYNDVPFILDLIEDAAIDRICFYHLVYSGRGSKMIREDITHEQSRQLLDLLIERTIDLHNRGLNKEVLTVDNHADGVYIYLKTLKRDPDKAREIINLLRQNGGNRSGMAFASVGPTGEIHPDQFTRHISFGNVRETSFADIWTCTKNPIQAGLKNRKPLLKGRCSTCSWQDCCNGNFRARAEAVSGDFWEADPACYLTENEIQGMEVFSQ
ncbi:MAG: putative heme d1 biosynthesis radical SAM protein NirJ1 [Bacillota bacterium]